MKKIFLASLVFAVMALIVTAAPLRIMAQTGNQSGDAHQNVIAPFENTPAVAGGGGGTWTVMGLLTMFVWVVQWTYTVLFVAAVLIFLFAAYNFIVGGSNEERIKVAKKQLMYGVVAIVVALLSMEVVYAIDMFLRTGR
jgi:ABC-type multidrug transport system fused ATPase/permease subunit